MVKLERVLEFFLIERYLVSLSMQGEGVLVSAGYFTGLCRS